VERAKSMLFVLLGAVPLVVAGAGLVAFLLLRAGYGLLIGLLLPFATSLLLVVALATVLGRAAGGRGSGGADDV